MAGPPGMRPPCPPVHPCLVDTCGQGRRDGSRQTDVNPSLGLPPPAHASPSGALGGDTISPPTWGGELFRISGNRENPENPSRPTRTFQKESWREKASGSEGRAPKRPTQRLAGTGRWQVVGSDAHCPGLAW